MMESQLPQVTQAAHTVGETGLIATLSGALVLMGKALVDLMRRKSGTTLTTAAHAQLRSELKAELRESMDELKDDLRAIRRNTNEINDKLQTLVTEVAVLKHRVSEIERRTGH